VSSPPPGPRGAPHARVPAAAREQLLVRAQFGDSPAADERDRARPAPRPAGGRSAVEESVLEETVLMEREFSLHINGCVACRQAFLPGGAHELAVGWLCSEGYIERAGDILEPEGSAASIGSGSGYALAAARAFCEGTDWPPERIARRAIELASEICIYTDNVVTLEVLE